MLGMDTVAARLLVHIICLISTALENKTLRSLEGKPKSVLLVVFYEAHVQDYERSLEDVVALGILSCQERQQVCVLTADKAESIEADFVLLDLCQTKSPDLMYDRRRLRIAMTRARQAEAIFMRRSVFAGSEIVPVKMPNGQVRGIFGQIHSDVKRFGGVEIE
ncbi:hypothetical protein N658DRAFT_110022 [Parathielavia hyrcaniae]|uniref:Uncharacterized protein n=1 Tax=Parathielavia hyrcaniae TaxID=113614 RepID=A0AAN6QBC4_9PEZI|nr:hypothetical protein N658DRAFT_110022 [Parathielavia hyrcaniae]